jgi:tetratricopeptide (TPR) repeat protein
MSEFCWTIFQGIRAPFAAWTIALVLGFMPYRAALAQEADPTKGEAASEEGKRDGAKRAFKSAVELFSVENYAAALQEFERSYALAPRPVVLFNIAMCHKVLGDLVVGAEFLERYLNDSEDSSAERQAKAKTALEQIDRQLVWVELGVAQSDARILVNSQPLDSAAHGGTMRLLPGVHEIRIEKDGFASFVQLVKGKAGDKFHIEVTLRPQSEATEMPPKPVLTGTDSVVPATAAKTPTTQLTTRQPTRSNILVTSSALLGTAAAALALGTAFAVVREHTDVERAEAAVRHRDAAELADVKQQAQVHGGVAVASFVVGGALVATAVTRILIHRHREKKTREKIAATSHATYHVAQ